MSQQHVGAVLSPCPPARGNPASTPLLCSLSRCETASCPPVQLLGLGGSDGAWLLRAAPLRTLACSVLPLLPVPVPEALATRSQKQGLRCSVLCCSVLWSYNFLEVMQDPVILQLLLLPFPGLQSIQPRAENKSVDLLRLCLVLAFLSVEKTF